MSKVIAVLIVPGQFEVAVETSKGYFVTNYPDTEIGVTEFLAAIRSALETEPGRLYPYGAYDGPENLRTGLRDPGIGDAPWIVRDDSIKIYLASQPTEKLNAQIVEKMCLFYLPRTYMQLYPTTARAKEFYRSPSAD